MAFIKLPCGALTNGEEKEKLHKIYNEVKNLSIYEISENVGVEHKYGRNIYRGILKKEYRDTDVLDLAIICDSGYRFFGGSSALDEESGKFEVEIEFD